MDFSLQNDKFTDPGHENMIVAFERKMCHVFFKICSLCNIGRRGLRQLSEERSMGSKFQKSLKNVSTYSTNRLVQVKYCVIPVHKNLLKYLTLN